MGLLEKLVAARARSQAHKRELRAQKIQSQRSWQEIDDELREYVKRYDADIIAQLDNIYVFADRLIVLGQSPTQYSNPGAVMSMHLPDSAPIRGVRGSVVAVEGGGCLTIVGPEAEWLFIIRASYMSDAEMFVGYLNETALVMG